MWSKTMKPSIITLFTLLLVALSQGKRLPAVYELEVLGDPGAEEYRFVRKDITEEATKEESQKPDDSFLEQEKRDADQDLKKDIGGAVIQEESLKAEDAFLKQEKREVDKGFVRKDITEEATKEESQKPDDSFLEQEKRDVDQDLKKDIGGAVIQEESLEAEDAFLEQEKRDEDKGYVSIGCWKDNWRKRAIPKIDGSDGRLQGKYKERSNAIEKCYEVARERKMDVFAVQNGGQCFAAGDENSHKKLGSSNKCKNGKGGPDANDVYRITNKEYEERCSWSNTFQGDSLSCPKDTVATGHCVGGKNVECATNTWLRLKCCKMEPTESASDCETKRHRWNDKKNCPGYKPFINRISYQGSWDIAYNCCQLSKYKVDYNKCEWKYGNFGISISCEDNAVVTGRCGLGGYNPDGCRGNTSQHGIRCCPIQKV